jgi:hypothetical protein
MEKTILAEREAMFFDALDSATDGLVATVFVQTDRVSHMFWRGLDEGHPLYSETGEVERQAVPWIYGEADRILGETMARLNPNDRLVVLSDHGFSSFRRAVHLNRWLADNGYLALREGSDSSPEAFARVDWTRTRAYAVGLSGLYLNLRGREGEGTVRADEVERLKRELIHDLEAATDPETGADMISKVDDARDAYRGAQVGNAPDLLVGYAENYRASWQTALGAVPEILVEDNRKNWSGDHIIDPTLVPGILLTSFVPDRPVGSIVDVPGLVNASLARADGAAVAVLGGSRGVFDLASPVLAGINGRLLGWLPGIVQLAIWAFVAAVISMGLYGLTSRQRELHELKPRIAAVRNELLDYDGPIGGLWRLIGRHFRLIGRQLWLTFVPAVIGSIPVLFILVWLSNAYGNRLPVPGQPVQVEAQAVAGQRLPPLEWQGVAATEVGRDGGWQVPWPTPGAPARLVDADGTPLVALPTATATPVVHQRRWWNELIGNPAGYLPSPGYVDAVTIGLPAQEYLPLGPTWLRSWFVPFFTLLVIFSLIIKFRWRLR